MASPNESRNKGEGKGDGRKRKSENSTGTDNYGNQDEPGTQDVLQTSPGNPPSGKKSKMGPRRGKHTPEPDYSDMVKKSMENTTRTNQACDRCKGRKMKCDSDPESCANCRASDTQCTHTHPITKTTWLRGEPERLRRENEMLKEENTRLQIEITRRDELLHQLTDNRNGQATMMNVPLQGQKPGYGMAHVSGYSPFTYRPGHASPFQTTQSHYHQVPSSCMDSGSYQQNTGVTLPPILPQQQQQQQQQPHMSHSYNTATTGPSTTGFDIPAVTAPVTSAPATSSTLYAQHRDPQTDNDTGAGNGNGNGDGAGEYQQKGWPY